jgi:hypothetical protein
MYSDSNVHVGFRLNLLRISQAYQVPSPFIHLTFCFKSLAMQSDQSPCGHVESKNPKGLFTLVTKGRDQSFSCIVIGGKVGAGPSSLYTIKSDQGLQ